MKITKRTSKRYIYLIISLSIAALYITYEPFKSSSSEILILFTSRSSESIIGYLNSFNGMRPVVSIGLMILQALIFPFKYEIMIFANARAFGELAGLCLSLIGRILGAYICYDIGESLMSNRMVLFIRKLNVGGMITNYMRTSSWVHIFIRLLPLNFDLISYLAGIMQLDSKKYMLNSIVWISLTTLVYSVKKGYFNHSYEMGIGYLRLILSIVVIVIIVKKYNEGINHVS